MKKIYILLALVILLGATAVSAEEALPYDEPAPHVLGYYIPSGHYCVTDYRDGNPFTVCYCDCEVIIECETCTECKDCEQCEKPVIPKCNSGRGNGSELYWDGNKWVDCDPGNSGKNQGGD